MIFYRTFNVTKHKVFEIQIDDFSSATLFNFEINWTRNCDHAGFRFWLCWPSFTFTVAIEDSRHWNHDKNRWYKEDEYEDDD